MGKYAAALDTTDLGNWDDEGVEALVTHVAQNFDGIVGIMAEQAIRNGSMEAKRQAMGMFFQDKLPGGSVSLSMLQAPSDVGSVPGMPRVPNTLEEWESTAFDMASNKMACMSPEQIERQAELTGLPLAEARRQLWKILFDGSLEDAWRRTEREAA
jgi:hypothetical protein